MFAPPWPWRHSCRSSPSLVRCTRRTRTSRRTRRVRHVTPLFPHALRGSPTSVDTPASILGGRPHTLVTAHAYYDPGLGYMDALELCSGAWPWPPSARKARASRSAPKRHNTSTCTIPTWHVQALAGTTCTSALSPAPRSSYQDQAAVWTGAPWTGSRRRRSPRWTSCSCRRPARARARARCWHHLLLCDYSVALQLPSTCSHACLRRVERATCGCYTSPAYILLFLNPRVFLFLFPRAAAGRYARGAG